MRSRVALNIPSETRPAPHHPVPSTAATNQSNEPRYVPRTATEAAQLDGTRCGAERGDVRRSSQGTGGDAPQEPVAGSTQWHWVAFRPRHLPYGSSVQRQVRPAFGPGYVSPNHDASGRLLAKRVYKGKHSDKPALQSDVVKNELNPRWRTHLLDLTELCHCHGHGGTVDLSKRVLIDVWDDDVGSSDDFMCFVEVTLRDLVTAASSRAPIALLPPPEPAKQRVGRLYVDKAEVRCRRGACVCLCGRGLMRVGSQVGFPEVQVRDKGRAARGVEGLLLANKTPLLLQVPPHSTPPRSSPAP